MTYRSELVVDAVSHGYNHTPENYKLDFSDEFDAGNFQVADLLSPDGWEIPEEKYFTDHTAEELAGVLFAESDVDFTIYHATAITDYFYDGYSALDKGIEMREANPERVAVYGSVNPLDDDALDQMEHQVTNLDVDGIKLYPAHFRDGKTLGIQLDDPETGGRILPKAKELGVDIVSVHKALPLGKSARKHFNVEDVEEAAATYPDMTFEVVHAGFSFLEETLWLLGRFENVYANFEITSNLITARPRDFAEILGELLYWAGPDRILFATGCTFTHPQPLIEAFWDFQIPQDMQEEHGYPALTDEMRAKIMGLNALEMLDRDPEAVREATADDEWSREMAERGGHAEPWSSIEVRSGS